jgi:hypothetical protein
MTKVGSLVELSDESGSGVMEVTDALLVIVPRPSEATVAVNSTMPVAAARTDAMQPT